MEVTKETKFGSKVAYGMRMMSKLRIHPQYRESTWYYTRRWKLIATQ